jgi:hypothetical protein
MRNMKSIGLIALMLSVFAMTPTVAANCGNDKDVGKARGCAAPAPALGTGLLGGLILAFGIAVALRKR